MRVLQGDGGVQSVLLVPSGLTPLIDERDPATLALRAFAVGLTTYVPTYVPLLDIKPERQRRPPGYSQKRSATRDV